MEASIGKRKCVFILIVAALVLGGAACSAAGANPLLSGYGGPGQGSQVILGSTVVNGSKSKGDRQGGSQIRGSGGESVSSIAAAIAVPAGTGARAGATSRGVERASRRSSSRPRGAGRAGRAPREQLKRHASPGIVPQRAATPVLGISQDDLIGIVVASCVLFLVGLLTRRSARSGAGRRQSQAQASAHRIDR
jgi:hypothetical protein